VSRFAHWSDRLIISARFERITSILMKMRRVVGGNLTEFTRARSIFVASCLKEKNKKLKMISKNPESIVENMSNSIDYSE